MSILFLTNVIVADANQETSYEEMYEYLVEHQLPMIILSQLSYEEILNIYDNIKENGIIPEIFSSSANIDSNETNNQPYGLINQDNFEVDIILLPFYTGNKLNNVLVGITWQWNNAHPFSKLEDVVRVSWDSDCFSFDSDNFLKTDFRYTYAGECIEYNESTLPAEATLGDLAFYSDVYSGLGADRGGTCLFYLFPSTPMYKGETNTTSITMTYYHNTAVIPFIADIGILFADDKISITFSDNFVDTLSCSTIFKYG